MATEAQRQQNLLNSGFLDNLGTQPEPVALDNVEQIFVKHMGRLLEALQRNLNTQKNGREISASGTLSQSIRVEYTKGSAKYEAEFYMASYADYVDKGVQGIGPKNKNTTSPYKFKTAFPGKDMQKALILWVRQKSILSDVTAPKGLRGKHTSGYLRNKVRRNDLAIALGIGIKRHGIAATNFKQVSINEVLADMTKELAQALAKDIVVNINTERLK
ncbi:hypothetical protein FHW36_10669 [Chitinophaga polysaccharea]|uniref:HK97 gp10 family phage protein n=1 Tax=Chitinophaga polysaccharea TaxID=1293035 RepID=A0A561PL65_9BACT|nr:hypothetical protein [Chitinophaga polysaccharea]TWF38846.1 hypothetical protein FHW36_10669 [Chitinophaga polysaccharea]